MFAGLARTQISPGWVMVSTARGLLVVVSEVVREDENEGVPCCNQSCRVQYGVKTHAVIIQVRSIELKRPRECAARLGTQVMSSLYSKETRGANECARLRASRNFGLRLASVGGKYI